MADLVTLFGIVSIFGSIYFSVPVLLFLWLTKDKKLCINFILSFIAVTAITYGIKFIFQIPRPLSPGAPEPLSPPPFYETAFPSGHSARAFLYSVFLSQKFEKFDQYLFYLLAALAAIGRVVTGDHFPIDIIVGSIIGFAVGKIFLKYQDVLFKKLKILNIA